MSEARERPVVVVLGATGGIGSEVSRRLHQTGVDLVLGGRSRERLDGLARSLGAESRTVEAENVSTIEACIAHAGERYGRLDGVVNCMGNLLLKSAHLTTDEEWQRTLQVNLTSSFAVLRAAAPAMTPGGGSVVFVSSAAAKLGIANHEAIAAAKGGIEGLTRSGAATYGHRGIRVNAVSPGLVRTPLTKQITSNERALDASTRMHVLRRIGEPGDVASAILWLLDAQQSWVTGQIIGVDGGLGSVRSRG